MSDEIKLTSIKMAADKSEFTDGDAIKKIRGKITALYEIRKGDDYEYQNGEFEGEDGGKIRICFSKCSQSPSIKGKKVTITAHKGKDGWTGIKVLDKPYEKNGEQKVQRELRITPTANIEIEGGGSSSGNSGTGKTNTGTGGGGGQSQPKFDGHPQPVLEDMIALHRNIFNLVNEKYEDCVMEVDFAPFIATIFIEAAKSGLAFNYRERASKPVPVKYPPAPTDPNEWKECVMPWGKATAGKKLSELDDETLKTVHKYFDEKKDNSALAECVYQAARDRKIFAKEEEEARKKAEQEAADNAALDAAPDDIPF